MLVLLIAADGVSEVTKPTPKRAPNLRQPLGSEYQKRDHQHEQQVRWLKNVADHEYRA
jgi:hypothetical protein